MKNTIKIAQVVYEANTAYCNAFDTSIQTHTKWHDAPAYHRRTFVIGVRALQLNQSLTEIELHEIWRNVLTDHGWIYGELKDEEAKTHPALVPWGNLLPDQKVKYKLLRAIVLALI